MQFVDPDSHQAMIRHGLKTGFAAVTVEGMRDIAGGRTPSGEALLKALDEAEARLRELRKGGATRRFHLQKLIQFFAFYHSAQSMGKDILLYGENPVFSVSPS